MERKSIGSFIAILRKANGLTQRELADKLGVSDKAVSRWERDETAPDLYLIPVIAEIFGVTSDELLRGERIGESAPPPEKQNEKTERQIKTVLKKVRTEFLTKTLICVLIAVVGLLAAMLCNFAFYKCELGFFIGSVFFTAAVIIEIVFAVLAFSGLDAEEFEGEHLAETRKYIIKKTETLIFLAFELFAYTLPLPIAASQTSYTDVKVNFGSWFLYGIIFAAIAALICLFVNMAVDKAAEKKGIYAVGEKTARRRSLVKFCFASPLPGLAKVFLPLIAVTIVLNIVCLNVFDYEFFLRNKGRVWENANDFVEYMETSLAGNGEVSQDDYVVWPTYLVWVHTENGSTQIKFRWQNRFITDFNINGVTSEDVQSGHNGYIYTHAYTDEVYTDEVYTDEDIPPYNPNENYDIPNFHAITYSRQETSDARLWAENIAVCFALAYLAEIVTLAIIYTVKVVKNFNKEESV